MSKMNVVVADEVVVWKGALSKRFPQFGGGVICRVYVMIFRGFGRGLARGGARWLALLLRMLCVCGIARCCWSYN